MALAEIHEEGMGAPQASGETFGIENQQQPGFYVEGGPPVIADDRPDLRLVPPVKESQEPPVYPSPLEDSFPDVPLERPQIHLDEDFMLDAKQIAAGLLEADQAIQTAKGDLAKAQRKKEAYEIHARRVAHDPQAADLAKVMPKEDLDRLGIERSRLP